MTISNSMPVTALEQKLNNLVAEREAWEAGAYTASNQQLYSLLDQCLTVYNDAKHSTLLRAKITQMLVDRGSPQNTSTSTLTKIVRLVFGNCGKRAYSYARVLSVAAAEKPENVSLATFITNNGGIEEIRRRSKTGVSPSVLRQQSIAAATKYLLDAQGIIKVETRAEIAPHKETENNLSLAVVRRNADGTSSIVYGIQDKTLLNHALVLAGKKLGAEQKNTIAVADEVTRKQLLTKLISEVLAA